MCVRVCTRVHTSQAFLSLSSFPYHSHSCFHPPHVLHPAVSALRPEVCALTVWGLTLHSCCLHVCYSPLWRFPHAPHSFLCHVRLDDGWCWWRTLFFFLPLFAIFMSPTTAAPQLSANLTTMKKSTMMNCQLDFLFSICCRCSFCTLSVYTTGKWTERKKNQKKIWIIWRTGMFNGRMVRGVKKWKPNNAENVKVIKMKESIKKS